MARSSSSSSTHNGGIAATENKCVALERSDSSKYELRCYPTWLPWLTAGVCVTSGVFSSVVFKWQNYQYAPKYEGGKLEQFNGALLQTQLMFIGEFLALLCFFVDSFFSRRKGKQNLLDFVVSEQELLGPKGKWWYWPIAAFCDFVATLCINTSMTITYASTVSMLRNFMVVIAGVFQVVLIRKAVKVHEWGGIGMIIIALLLTTIPALMDPDGGDDITVGKTVLGVFLAVIGTSVQAFMLLLEEWFFRKGRYSPLKAVGFEGIGGLVYSFIAWPIYQVVGAEDVTGSWYQQLKSGVVTILSCIYIPCATVFNIAGISTTKLAGGLLRGVCFAVRAPLVWIVSLAARWQDFDWYSLASALVFLVGFMIYINKIGFAVGSKNHRLMVRPVPCCCTNPELDDPYPGDEIPVKEQYAGSDV